MATNVIEILTDELSKLEARRAEVESQLKTIEKVKPKPNESKTSDESSPAKESDVQANVLLTTYNDLKKRHFHLQNDLAAVSSANQDLKIENSILSKKCDYLSIELARLANVDLAAELIRLSRFASDNSPLNANGERISYGTTEFGDTLPSLANDSYKSSDDDTQIVTERPVKEIPVKRVRGRPRKTPIATQSASLADEFAPKKRGRKPGFKLVKASGEQSTGCIADRIGSVATLKKRKRGNITNTARKQQYDELKMEEEARKRACNESRQKQMIKKWQAETKVTEESNSESPL